MRFIVLFLGHPGGCAWWRRLVSGGRPDTRRVGWLVTGTGRSRIVVGGFDLPRPGAPDRLRGRWADADPGRYDGEVPAAPGQEWQAESLVRAANRCEPARCLQGWGSRNARPSYHRKEFFPMGTATSGTDFKAVQT